jgi:hypothetical protein
MRCGSSSPSFAIHSLLYSHFLHTGHQNVQKLPIHDSRLAYEQRDGDVVSEIWRCTDTTKRNGDVVGGCGFEWRGRQFCFETEAWCVPPFLASSRKARIFSGRALIPSFPTYPVGLNAISKLWSSQR